MPDRPQTPWTELVVALPAPPEADVAPVVPARPVRVTTRLHDGSTTTLDVEVVARAPGMVRIAQDRGVEPAWLAWIPADDVRPEPPSGLDHGAGPDAPDLPQPRPSPE
ncbi:hypothetical protein [Cellulomonas sp. NS3]|uniref:hypothetical protein n=1 Tax=Cellulomonas sp. NS3 TaxID=2973977 RepID=UPI002163C878|nr:hypothetical protein [Cellulomonas sp. NS3]